jgi:AP-2 complex subunit beta-1
VALAISKIFLKMIKIKPEISDRVLQILRKSLLAYLNNDLPELEYVVLKHLEYLIVTFGSEGYRNQFKRFLLSWGEPTYLKIAKVQILEKLIWKDNQADIINEMAEYLFDEDISAETVAALSRILLKSEEGEARFIIKTIIKTV